MLQDEVIEFINQTKLLPVSVTLDSHFFEDIAFDSLAFIVFLLEIEKKYLITFDIMEIEQCLKVDRLIALIELKVKER